MKQLITRALFTYWDSVRGDRLTPERADIDPTGIRDLLGHTFMLEVDDAGRFPFCLSGTRINALFLRELRNSSFTDLWRSSERSDIARLLFSVLEDQTPAILGAAAAPAGRFSVDLEILLLPLRHRGKTHARILGSCAPAMHASWFGLVAAEPLIQRSLRILRPGERADGAVPAPRVANLPTGTRSGALPSITRINHLTVYDSRQR